MEHRVLVSVLAVVLVLNAAGCSGLQAGRGPRESAVQVMPAQVPEPVRATIRQLIGGGTIETIKQTGKTVEPSTLWQRPC